MKTIIRTDLFKVLLSAIVIQKGFNVRNDMGDIDALAKSLATLGQQNPAIGVKVKGEDKYNLISGHRRMLAIEIANKKYIGKPGYLTEKITHLSLVIGVKDEKTQTLTMLLDGDGVKKLTDSELVEGFARLTAMGMKPKEIVSAVAMSQAQVYNIIAVAKAPEAIQEMVAKNEISVALVNEIQRSTKNADAQVSLAKDAVKEAKKAAPAKNGKSKKATSSNAKTSKVSADVAKLEAAIKLAPKTSAKAANLKAIVNKLKSKASAEEIAKHLK